jgi:hypothetical protein
MRGGGRQNHLVRGARSQERSQSPRGIGHDGNVRYLVVLGSLVGACGFGSSGQTTPVDVAGGVVDAATDPGGDAASDATGDATSDASIDSPAGPSWVVIETLTLPSTPATVVASTTVLAAGVGYRLRASGTYETKPRQGNQPAISVDAEYRDFSNPTDSGIVDFGIAVDDLPVDGNMNPVWGVYRASHTYEVDWMGNGMVIHAGIVDGASFSDYDNNTGSLTLQILAFQ